MRFGSALEKAGYHLFTERLQTIPWPSHRPAWGHRATDRKTAEGPSREGHEGSLAGRRIVGERTINPQGGASWKMMELIHFSGAVDVAEAEAFRVSVMTPSPSSFATPAIRVPQSPVHDRLRHRA